MPLLGSIGEIAEARFRSSARTMQRRAGLGVVVAVFGLMALVFGMLALTLGLAAWIGLIPALVVLFSTSLAVAGIGLAMMSAEAKRARKQASRRRPLDKELARAALLSAAPHVGRRMPRGLFGIGLVVVGALLVVTRQKGDLDE